MEVVKFRTVTITEFSIKPISLMDIICNSTMKKSTFPVYFHDSSREIRNFDFGADGCIVAKIYDHDIGEFIPDVWINIDTSSNLMIDFAILCVSIEDSNVVTGDIEIKYETYIVNCNDIEGLKDLMNHIEKKYNKNIDFFTFDKRILMGGIKNERKNVISG